MALFEEEKGYASKPGADGDLFNNAISRLRGQTITTT